MDLDLLTIVLRYALVIPAIVLHEVSHGYVAYLLGDTTAKDRGRLTLNPIKHVDPVGTIILPAILVVAGQPAFGWAKPVPVNPARFKDHRKGMFLTGFAGPTTNVVLALLAGILFRVTVPFAEAGIFVELIALAAFYFCQINLVLVFFNLIPIPPLDGSRVIPLVLSDKAMVTYHQIERYGFLILMALIFIAPRVLNVDILGMYFQYTVVPLVELFTGV